MILKHPTSRNQRRQLRKAKDKFDLNSDRVGHVNKTLLEEKEILKDLKIVQDENM